MNPFLRFVFALTLVFPVAVHAIDLREELDESTFKESGLDKLSSEELAILNSAIGKLMGEQEVAIRAETELPQGEDSFGLESVKQRVQALFQRSAPKTIESSIKGEFRGWRGGTIFRLENGQVWRQTDGDTFIVNVKDPKVTIRRGAFGSYLLKIEGYNSSAKVERVE